MSLTRLLVAELQDRLYNSNSHYSQADKNLASSTSQVNNNSKINIENLISDFTKNQNTEFKKQAEKYTSALLGIGHTGTRYFTKSNLHFQAELAVAHKAVATVIAKDWAAKNNLIELHTKVKNHNEYLLRPDLGRRLNDEALAILNNKAKQNIDIQVILADGLSAVACMKSGLEILSAFERQCKNNSWTMGSPLFARFARVWLQDEIGEKVNAKISLIILGERPGLGTGDGLSAYMVYNPKIGNTDSDRNMISNIHKRGIPPEEAAVKLAKLAGSMLEQNRSGVNLDLSRMEKNRKTI